MKLTKPQRETLRVLSIGPRRMNNHYPPIMALVRYGLAAERASGVRRLSHPLYEITDDGRRLLEDDSAARAAT